MTNTNQIIIPICSHCELPANSLAPTQPFSMRTPTKASSHNQPLPWRKTHSAFKKFRERKDKKAQACATDAFQAQNLPPQPIRIYKLAPRPTSNMQIQLFFSSLAEAQPQFGYFDPNLAPLYRMQQSAVPLPDLQEVDNLASRSKAKSSTKKQQLPSQMNCIKIQPLPTKKSEQIKNECLPITCEDDPFIIVRRESHHKTPKTVKNKPIKKEKNHKDVPERPHKKIDSLVPGKSADCQQMIPEDEGISLSQAFRAPLAPTRHSDLRLEVIQIESSSQETPQSEEGSKQKHQPFVHCD